MSDPKKIEKALEEMRIGLEEAIEEAIQNIKQRLEELKDGKPSTPVNPRNSPSSSLDRVSVQTLTDARAKMEKSAEDAIVLITVTTEEAEKAIKEMIQKIHEATELTAKKMEEVMKVTTTTIMESTVVALSRLTEGINVVIEATSRQQVPEKSHEDSSNEHTPL